ncbi:GntR family transcriptional regulator [Roseiflexus sp.]|uniref:GntR family transcriptional regulator n=1 Tax=Roseiflexus sp. TaxID=2562120 RepID=UPI00398B71FA
MTTTDPDSQDETTQRSLRASDIVHLLEQQIRSGEYRFGMRLPTVRELADRYHVNKNTAARAYQTLEQRGLIEVSRGRGAFVCAEFAYEQPAARHEQPTIQQQIERLVQTARQSGLSRSRLLDLINSAVHQSYGSEAPLVLFVECNRRDVETLGDELELIADVPMDRALLDDVLRDPVTFAQRYDLIVTTFQHLGQIRQATPASARQRIIGVLATPSHESLLALARLHVPTFGLVCDSPGTIESLTHIIRTYHPTSVVIPTLIDDRTRLHEMIEQVDALVVTRSCRERLLALNPVLPMITVVFTIDQQSIDFLRQRLEETTRLNALQPRV